jgi:PAS domain S-box-containing protein
MPGEPVRFLLVDDLEDNLTALEGLLRRDGLELSTARSGPEALELLLVHEFALALVDVQMPGMDGFELAELMRGTERTRAVPIIFLTAVANDERRRFRGYEAGAVDYLTKPIEPHVLRSKAGLFFDYASQRRDLLARCDELKASNDRLTAHVDNSPLAVIEFDSELRVALWSAGAERMLGWAAEEVLGKRIGELRWVHEEDAATVATLSAEMMAGRQARNVHANRNYRKDGTVIHCEWYNSAIFDREGRLASIRAQVLDVTDRKRAEEALHRKSMQLRELAAELQATYDQSPIGMLQLDRELRYVRVNERMAAMNGIAAAEHIGRTLDEMVPDLAPKVGPHFRRVIDTGEAVIDFELEGRTAADPGIEHTWLASWFPLRGSGGEVIGVNVVAQDITLRKQAEQQIRLLMGEVSHRAKNLLTVVLAIVRQTARNNPPADLADRLARRIMGLAASQDLIIKGDWRSIALSDLVRSQLAPFGEELLPRVRIAGPPITLAPTAAQGIGMAFHELATNAMKHGALSHRDGRVTVEWSLAGNGAEPRLHLRWREDGGPPVEKPHHRGFGRTVIEQMAALTVGGKVELDYDPGGLKWTLEAPLDAISAGEKSAPATVR